MDKDRKWTQTEEVFSLMTSVHQGGAAEKELAIQSLEEMLPQIVAPLLRGRVTGLVRKFRNARIIEGMKTP